MSEQENEHSSPAVTGSINITDILGIGAASKNLAPAASEVVRALSAGMGKIYAPVDIYVTEIAKGAANRRNVKADAEAYLQSNTRDPAVLEAMRDRLLGTEYRRQINIQEAEAAAVDWANRLPPNSNPATISSDFVVEWLEGVKDVSDDNVREIWARLLASATTETSGRAPKPVVDLLRQFDAELAKGLSELTKVAIFGRHGTPAVIGRKLISDVGREIGVISETGGALTSLKCGYVHLYSQPPLIETWELGSRALWLAEALFDPISDEDCIRTFMAQYEHIKDAIWPPAVQADLNIIIAAKGKVITCGPPLDGVEVDPTAKSAVLDAAAMFAWDAIPLGHELRKLFFDLVEIQNYRPGGAVDVGELSFALPHGDH